MNFNQNRKIMLIIPSLRGGGAERVAENLLNNLDKTQDIILCLFGKNNSQKLPMNIKVRCLPLKSSKNVLYAVANFFLLIFHLSKIIREEMPCSILSFMDYPNIIAIISNYLAGRKARVNISIHTIPELHFKKYSNSKWNVSISILMKLLYNRADKIIAVSNFIRKDLILNYNIKKAKVVVIYNPIDTSKIDMLAEEEVSHPWFKENVPVVLSVGRLSKEKGFNHLLKAFAIVRGKMNVRLLLVGEGGEEEYLKSLSNKLGVNENVCFAGFQENPYKYMRKSTIYVLSSLYEGFPNVLVEAMACGVPIVSTLYNLNTNEIIEHEKNGLLVPVADEKALAEAMLRLLNNPEERKQYALCAKEKVKEFSIEKITEQYRMVLLDI